MDVNGMMERATLLHRSGKLEDARRLYEEISRGAPDFAEAWHRLGLIAQAAGQLDEAAGFMVRAIRLDERQPLYLFGLGLVMQERNEPGEAEKLFRQALALNPDLAPAYNHLGVVLQEARRTDEALQCFREAVRCHPGYARAYNNLGNLLKMQGNPGEAITCFREALRLNPQYSLALVNLAGALMEQGDLGEAEKFYSRAIALNPGDAQNYSLLGRLYIFQFKMQEAEQAFRKALELNPGNEPNWNLLSYVLREQGKMEAAAEASRHALTMNPDSMQALLALELALPPVYRDRTHLLESRRRFSEGLDRVIAEAGRFTRQSIPISVTDLNWGNFFLAYQGQNDRELQVRYATFLVTVLSGILPEFLQPIRADNAANRRRLKVGFVSSFFRDCTVGAYFKAWITRLDKQNIETFVYNTGYQYDDVSKEIQMGSSHYMQLRGKNLRDIAHQIKNDSLDVLVYPEVGMDLTLCTLSALRLAPVQCAGWGHPITTGHQNIDYYLSCASMEPENAREHYTEQLVLLSGIGTYYTKPLCASHADRKRFSLPAERHLYLCPQSLHKIHPDNDEIFLDILEQDQETTLVFFQGMCAAITQIFMARLERGMAARKLAVLKRVIFLPRLDRGAYLQVNRSCDVMLDTLYWSGGNTSLDALACALPIVTLPGEFMRGRQSYAMLKAIGLDELIAQDKNSYVAIALRLGTDAAWREKIRQRIAHDAGKIFENGLPVKELEQFLLSRFTA